MPEDIIYGKKVILFGFKPEDLNKFVQLHREDKFGYMQDFCLKEMSDDEAKRYITAMVLSGQMKCWTAYTKEGKNARLAGFIYITDLTSFSCTVSGIMDKEFAKGITRKFRDKKYTYSEDALRTTVNYLFNGAGLERLDTSIMVNNRRALAIAKKVGFVQEGLARKALKIDDRYLDLICLGLLKEEYKNGKEERAVN